MKFLYYLAAFGNPYFSKKVEVLLHNLIYLNEHLNQSFDLIINCYETDQKTIEYINRLAKNLNFIDNFYLYNKKGVLTELFLTNPYNKLVNNYDYVLFTLDDIKIININIWDMIRVKRKYNIRFLSPKVLNSTKYFKYMSKYNRNIVTINNCLEIFMLLFSSKDFFKFISLYTIKNKWMWGIDHLFGYYKIRAGMVNRYSVNHLFTGGSNKHLARRLAEEYLKEKKIPFRTLRHIRNKYSAVSRFIHEKRR